MSGHREAEELDQVHIALLMGTPRLEADARGIICTLSLLGSRLVACGPSLEGSLG